MTRVSLGAQSFQPHLLEVLERRATPDVVRRAFYHLRDAGFDNISLDLIYGIPGQSAADLERDLEAALELAPEHLSLYELEAKPGTRFTHAHGEELARQAEAMEGYFERLVDVLTTAGYRWYETANFCLEPERAGGRDLRSRHNLAYWRGRDYVGLGIGAVSTVGDRRWRNAPRLRAYVEALAEGRRPPPRARAAVARGAGPRARDARPAARPAAAAEPVAGTLDARGARPDGGARARGAERRRRGRHARADPARALRRRRRRSRVDRVNTLQKLEFDVVTSGLSERQSAILQRVVEEYVATRPAGRVEDAGRRAAA